MTDAFTRKLLGLSSRKNFSLSLKRHIHFFDTYSAKSPIRLPHIDNVLQMITRIWHGRTSLQDAKRYLDFLLNDGTKEYKEIPGNLSIKVWKRVDTDCCHFYTVTEWEDLEGVRRFTGEDFEKAVYYPEDEGILLEFEEKVRHYESYDVSKVSPN